MDNEKCKGCKFYEEGQLCEEVGRIFKVTRERVRQVEQKAIRKRNRNIKESEDENGPNQRKT
jgi:DNA-directed RNA polymerase sigma subunit (sigma70/sigma32)